RPGGPPRHLGTLAPSSAAIPHRPGHRAVGAGRGRAALVLGGDHGRARVRGDAVTEIVALAAALVAWIGVTLVLVADGRRGLALGLLVTTAGLAIAVADLGHATYAAAALAAGGLVAAGL